MDKQAARDLFAAELNKFGERGLAKMVRGGIDNNNGGQAAIAAILTAVSEERARCAAKAREITEYYSTQFFREITDAETLAVHQSHPGMCDRISAAMGRFVSESIAKQIEGRDDG